MIKAVIVDDEKLWLEILSNKLSDHGTGVMVAARCSTAAEGIEAIRSHHPDLVFTDIEMPGMSGFDMLQQLNEVNFDVIFTTAFEKYAVKAFKYGALDYLLKPVDPQKLKLAIEKAERKKLRNAGNERIDLFFLSSSRE